MNDNEARAVPVGPQSNEVAAAYDAGVRDGYAAGRAVPVEGDRERLAALLRDVFPATQRDRWPFTAEDVADRIIAAGFRAGVSLTGESEA